MEFAARLLRLGENRSQCESNRLNDVERSVNNRRSGSLSSSCPPVSKTRRVRAVPKTKSIDRCFVWLAPAKL